MNKKIIYTIGLIVTLFFSQKAFADNYDFSAVAPSGQRLYYKKVSNNTVKVTYPNQNSNNNVDVYYNYSKPTGDLTIPISVTYDNITYSVSSIGDYAFRDCIGLTSVTIGNSINSIGNAAFLGCTGMMSVSIPNSVTSIGVYTFYNCTSLTSVSIGTSVTSIGEYTFYNCTALTTVSIGNSVTSIGVYAFYGCSSLTSVSIPNSVTSIYNDAFRDCIGLTSITIGESVTTIWGSAFHGCSGLTTVFFNADSCYSIGIDIFAQCTNLTTVHIGNNVKIIPRNAFYNCSELTSITIPNSVTYIGDHAFYGCSGLTSITIPNSVNSIGDYTFYKCTSLTSVSISNSVNSIGEYAFYQCTGLTSISIPHSVTDIGQYAFNYCNNLDTVYMHSKIPPTISYTTFDNIGWHNPLISRPIDIIFVLPSCSFPNYNADAKWQQHSDYFLEQTNDIDININLLINAPGRGLVGIEQQDNRNVRCDSTAIIYARANEGYHFSHWSNGNTANPDTITLVGDSTIKAYFIRLKTNSSDETTGYASHSKISECLEQIYARAYEGHHFDHWSNGSTANPDTITLMGDSTITAFFERNLYTLSANVSDTALGSVSFPNGDTALYLDTLMVVARPTAHYHVDHWSRNNIIINSSDNKDTIWVRMTGNGSVTCYFAIDRHTVVVATRNIVQGTVSASGSEFEYGESCTVEATANAGYTFKCWSNGVTANPYVFTVTENVNLTAIFMASRADTFTVIATSADPQMGSATANGFPSATVMNGETVTLTATANNGYHFVRWNDNNTNATRTITVTSDMSFTAYFEADESPTEGIGDIQAEDVKVYARNGRIVVEGASDETVKVFDIVGRPERGQELKTGVYIVKIGLRPAKKIVVMR